MRSLVLAVAAVLALAPAAVAKEITKGEVCGPDGCYAVADRAVLPLLGTGGPPRTPPTAAPYYDVRFTLSEGDHDVQLSVVAVPARHALRGDDGTWMQMAPDVASLVTKTAAGQRPYPASELAGAAAPAEPPSTDSPLWPEGAILALVAVAAAFVARGVWLRAAARRA